MAVFQTICSRRWLESAAIAIACLSVYAALAQQNFHGSDGLFLLIQKAKGAELHPTHLLYWPIVSVVDRLLAPLGLTLFETMRAASALGTALGIVLLHRAALRLGLDPVQSLWLAAACACAPGIVYFATVIEVHGVFFAWVGMTYWCLSLWLARRSVARGILLGVATGIATGTHPSGHLLWFVIAAFATRAWQQRHMALRPMLLSLGIACLTHAAVTLGLVALLQNPGARPVFAEQRRIVSMFLRIDWAELGGSLWREWLRAFFPLSVLPLLALLHRPLRGDLLVLIGPWLVYQGFAFALLLGIDETGAYLLPLVFPAAWITVRLMRNRDLPIVAALGLIASLVIVANHEAGSDAWPSRAEVRELTGDGRAVVLYGDGHDVAPIARWYPRAYWVELPLLLASEASYADLCATFDRGLAQLQREGREALVHIEMLNRIDPNLMTPSGVRFRDEHLRTRYTLEERRCGSWRYYSIRKRE